MSEQDDLVPPSSEEPDKPKKKRPRSLNDVARLNGEDRWEFRYHRPEVAEYIAKMLFKYRMNYEAAVSRMLNDEAKTEGVAAPTDATIIHYATVLKRSPQVKEALLVRANDLGIGEEGDKVFMGQLWADIMDREGKHHGTSMKLYSEISPGISNKSGRDKPQPLLLQGAGALLKKMGIEATEGIGEEPEEDEE